MPQVYSIFLFFSFQCKSGIFWWVLVYVWPHVADYICDISVVSM